MKPPLRNRDKFLIDEEGASPVAGVEAKAARKASAKPEKASVSKKVTRKVAVKKATAKTATAVKGQAKEAKPTKFVAASEKVVAKKSGPVARKRVAKRTTGLATALNGPAVADTASDTQAAIEASAV